MTILCCASEASSICSIRHEPHKYSNKHGKQNFNVSVDNGYIILKKKPKN